MCSDDCWLAESSNLARTTSFCWPRHFPYIAYNWGGPSNWIQGWINQAMSLHHNQAKQISVEKNLCNGVSATWTWCNDHRIICFCLFCFSNTTGVAYQHFCTNEKTKDCIQWLIFFLFTIIRFFFFFARSTHSNNNIKKKQYCFNLCKQCFCLSGNMLRNVWIHYSCKAIACFYSVCLYVQ